MSTKTYMRFLGTTNVLTALCLGLVIVGAFWG